MSKTGVTSLVIDLPTFHIQLTGNESPYGLTQTSHTLYQGFLEGKRGFFAEAVGEEDREKLVSVLVCALYCSTIPYPESVKLILGPSVKGWVAQETKGFLGYLLRLRKGAKPKDIAPLTEAINRLLWGEVSSSLRSPPKRWVAYGISRSQSKPKWLENGLI